VDDESSKKSLIVNCNYLQLASAFVLTFFTLEVHAEVPNGVQLAVILAKFDAYSIYTMLLLAFMTFIGLRWMLILIKRG